MSDTFDKIEQIAIIGLEGRFPGAKNIRQFWQNLADGVESISRFSDEDLLSRGVSEEIIKNPSHVKAGTIIEGADMFDAAFFGYAPLEATIMDPQQRIFLEVAWEALENAGYNCETYEGAIGVFAGTSGNDYRKRIPADELSIASGLESLEVMLGNDADFLTTRVSYKLNLKGPSLTIQTACSTSLVAVHQAYQSLLTYQCDMALAGGVCIRFPQGEGYLYQEGMIWSPDGHCRPFDAKAQGTLFGHGAGVVVLKRLSDALEDGDSILAVIKGSAINNDGAMKVGFTAPSVNGQAEVISMAMAIGEVEPDSIGYIEAHGTATPLGDPIEIEALTQAFRMQTDKIGFCAVGSLKSNIGHLDTAAGVAGLIKTVLALQNKKIPPSFYFTTPNPNIDFKNSPFYVNTTLQDWGNIGHPCRAGVSSFGIGGTNAHVVLEEAPPVETTESLKSWHLLPLSAKSVTALDSMTFNLVEHLKNNPDLGLADVAYTLQLGRKNFDHRRAVACSDLKDAVNTLSSQDPDRIVTSVAQTTNRDIVFMFSGQGSQHVNMCRDLYLEEPFFKKQVDNCAEILQPHLGMDLRGILYPEEDKVEEATKQITQTSITQPALFVIEYALAKFWNHSGITPSALVGHSIGEYVAACISGVFSLEDALQLVAARGRLMHSLSPGSMLAVPLSEKDIEPYLSQDISLAVLNSASMSVLSGEIDKIEDLNKVLSGKGIEGKILRTSHAFHSKMMDPILDDFQQKVEETNRNTPKIPFVSNVTGTWITDEQALDPNYWSSHLRNTVQFFRCAKTLLAAYPHGLLIEVGPGQTLTFLVKQHPDSTKQHGILPSARRPVERKNDVQYFLNTLGQLWSNGIQVDWTQLYANERRRRIPLPTYPFERKRYWIDRQKKTSTASCSALIAKETLDEIPESKPGIDRNRSAEEVKADGTEQLLVEIWQELLGVDNVQIDDNFFEMGGNSLMAVHLFVQIEKRFNIRLPLATLYEAPTIKGLCSLLKDEGYAVSWDSLVAIQPNGSKPPLFFMHSEGGNVLEYYDLSHHLGLDQPFYALQAKGLEGEKLEYYSIEEMASFYLKEIRNVQKKGPYYLGGYCLGGLIAYEAAQQLIKQGEEISQVVLVSTYNPHFQKSILSKMNPILRKCYQIGERIGLEADNLSALPFRVKAKYVLDRCHDVAILCQVSGEKFMDAISSKLQMKSINHSLAYNIKMFAKAHNKAFFDYVPKKLDCDVTIFRTSRQSKHLYPDLKLGWGDLVDKKLNIINISAYHKNILKPPHVKKLAEKLRACLDGVVKL